MAKLVILYNGRKLEEINLSTDKVRIGRSDINQVHLDNPTISRYHAEIYRQGLIFTLIDKKSTNGTLLNNFPVSRKQLNDYDEIRIGPYQLVFILESADEPKSVTRQSFDSSETQLELPVNS